MATPAALEAEHEHEIATHAVETYKNVPNRRSRRLRQTRVNKCICGAIAYHDRWYVPEEPTP